MKEGQPRGAQTGYPSVSHSHTPHVLVLGNGGSQLQSAEGLVFKGCVYPERCDTSSNWGGMSFRCLIKVENRELGEKNHS